MAKGDGMDTVQFGDFVRLAIGGTDIPVGWVGELISYDHQDLRERKQALVYFYGRVFQVDYNTLERVAVHPNEVQIGYKFELNRDFGCAKFGDIVTVVSIGDDIVDVVMDNGITISPQLRYLMTIPQYQDTQGSSISP
jgi:hypothetical protein